MGMSRVSTSEVLRLVQSRGFLAEKLWLLKLSATKVAQFGAFL